jgi:hypothetical protein
MSSHHAFSRLTSSSLGATIVRLSRRLRELDALSSRGQISVGLVDAITTRLSYGTDKSTTIGILYDGLVLGHYIRSFAWYS